MTRIARIIAIMTGLALVATGCLGQSDEEPSDTQRGAEATEVTLTIAANAVSGGKNAEEADWIENYVIPTFVEQQQADGVDVTVEFQSSGVDDEVGPRVTVEVRRLEDQLPALRRPRGGRAEAARSVVEQHGHRVDAGLVVGPRMNSQVQRPSPSKSPRATAPAVNSPVAMSCSPAAPAIGLTVSGPSCPVPSPRRMATRASHQRDDVHVPVPVEVCRRQPSERRAGRRWRGACHRLRGTPPHVNASRTDGCGARRLSPHGGPP